MKKYLLIFMCVFMFVLLTACGGKSVSFDTSQGLIEQQIKQGVSQQAENYGDSAQNQTDQIYEGLENQAEDQISEIVDVVTGASEGKVASVNGKSLVKNILYFFLILKQYLYNNLLKILIIWWIIIGIIVMFLKSKNKAMAKTVLWMFGFGVTVIILLIVFSPV